MTKGSRATDQKGDTEKQKGSRADSVDFREIRKDRWVEFAVKNKDVVNNELELVTFAYPWWEDIQRT